MNDSKVVLTTIREGGVTYTITIDWAEVRQMANRANASKGKKCRDGALSVQVVKGGAQ